MLGVDGSVARSLGLRSTTSDRKTVDASWTRVETALRGRLLFGKGDRASWLAIFAGYGYSTYVFDAAPADREIPTAQYHMLRFGSDARVTALPFFFTAAAEYDHVTSIGPLGTQQARTPGNGLTARLGVGLHLLPWLVARIDARFFWLRYDLDRSIAAHAIDDYGSLDAGFGAEF
jgi:hypothetical protein